MSYTEIGYEQRAEECVRLAALAADEMIKSELLKLRQTYLQIASRLRQNREAAERRTH